MIKTFADKPTQELYLTGRARRLPSEILTRGRRKLEQINAAAVLADLKIPPSNRLHDLKDDRKGQHSKSINEQWRVCFRFVDGDAYDVEICDYH